MREVALYLAPVLVALAVAIVIGAALGLVAANAVVMLGW